MSGEAVPDLAAAAGQRMTAEQQPDTARLIDGQPRDSSYRAVGRSGSASSSEPGGLLERAVGIEALHPNRAAEVEREPALCWRGPSSGVALA